ncbi:hypothetical protein TUM12370_18050 [Salmonella enterica subsp. enterica serovar Choleraesuis]|nr:hypothetical protein TUM12370_18050 [Salmonella enterica subsp. enterica serovar Choleraesuis]
MNTDVIKSFLVSLGFDVDEHGRQQFEATLVGVTKNVMKVGAAVEAAALGVVAFTAKTAAGLDTLYFASQRTGATAAGIQSIGYAASQTGGSAESARASMEGLAAFIRNNPGGEGFINRLGVQTRDASGQARDLSAVFTGLGQQLNSMPYYRARQYAGMLGIDENTLQAMRRGLGQFTTQYSEMAKSIGFNADTAAVSSNRFMTSLRSFGEMAGLARDKIGVGLTDGLAGALDRLRKNILDNFPKIESTISTGIKAVLWLAEAFGRMVYRLIQGAGEILDWWKSLDSGTQHLIEAFGALVVAWRLLNSSFLMSPIGVITSLILALGLLWDDYKTWKEHGQSLIDWAKWEPAIAQLKSALSWIGGKLTGLVDSVGGWKTVFTVLAAYVAGAWAVKMLSGISKVSKSFGPILAAMAAIDAWNKVGSAEQEARKEGVSTGEYLVNRMKEEDAKRQAGPNPMQGLLDKLPEWLGGAPAVKPAEAKPGTETSSTPPATVIHLSVPEQPAHTQAQQQPVAGKPPVKTVAVLSDEDGNRARQQTANGWLEKIFDGLSALGNAIVPSAAAEMNPVINIPPGNPPTVNVNVPAGSAPRGVRNNNPGNLNYAGQQGAVLERPGGRFARFETAFDGITALGRQLMRYFDGKTTGRPLRTLRDIIGTWAPGSENNTGAYISALAKKLNVRPDAMLNLRDPQMLSQLMNGIIHHENGRNPYSSELVTAAARNVASPSINQTTTIHVNGADSPQETARLVADRQSSVNSAFTQVWPTGPR